MYICDIFDSLLINYTVSAAVGAVGVRGSGSTKMMGPFAAPAPQHRQQGQVR
jgi:hypothetical protein